MDVREPSTRQRGDDGYTIDDGVPLSKINDTIEEEFTSEGVETIGGLVLEQLTRPPEHSGRAGNLWALDEAMSVETTRILTIKLHGREEHD
jgi:CBS domain containing-hemolysin-like protein